MFLAVRDIRFAKGRFALMGGVIALITLLLVLLSGLTAGLADQSTSAIGGLGGDRPVDAIAFGSPGSGAPKASFTESAVTAAQVERWESVPGVDSAEAVGISQTRLQSKDGATANVAAFGVEAGSRLAPGPVAAEGIVVGAGAAESLGVDRGDTVLLGGTELTVSAVVEDQWYSHTSVAWTALPTWASIARVTGADVAGTVAAVTFREGADVDTSLGDRAADTVTTTRTGAFEALGSFKSENGSLTLMQGFLYGISALVIVAFLSVWTVQRTRDIAVLKALGADSGYILRDAMTQAAVVLLAGAALGGGIGLLGGFAAAQAAPFLVTPATTLLPVAGIVLLGLGGAALAVGRVTKVDALIALGGN